MRRLLILIAFLFTHFFVLSQEESFYNFETYTQTNFSSPEVSSFEKVSLIPNDLSTGRLNLNIPIYTIKTGRLSYPLRLSYNSGGIKVDDLASEVGLGWSLSKSVISRQIVDANDFDNVGTQYFDPAGGEFGGTLSDPEFSQHWNVRNNNGSPRMGYFLKRMLNYRADIVVKQVDEMPDIYSLTAADGFSTKFYFRDIDTPIELNEMSSVIDGDKVKRFFENPENPWDFDFPMYDFGKIEVISNAGIKYTFEDYDVSITMGVNVPGELFPRRFTVPQVSAWHISEIEDLLTGDKIEFEYETYNSDPVTAPFDPYNINNGPAALLRFRSFKVVPKGSFLGGTFPSSTTCQPSPVTLTGMGMFNYHPNKFGHFKIHHTRYYVKNRLVNIKFNSGRVNFNWGANRLDSYNSKTLNNIRIYSKEDGTTNANKLINQFDFTFDYFSSGCGNNYKCKRLRLKEVKELDKPSYQFTYYNENSYFPSITNNKKDYLGYYNSNVTQPQNSNIIPNLYYYDYKQEYSILPFDIPTETNYTIYGDYDNDSPLLSNIRTWSLSRINYPTGAITEINYDLNEVNIFNHNTTVTGLRLSSLEIKDEGVPVRSINYQYVKNDGSSSGSFVNPPNYGRPTIWITNTVSSSDAHLSKWNVNSMHDAFIINQYPTIDADLTKGNYISYSHIKEEEIGNGYTRYEFTSNETHPNDYIRNDDTQEQLNDFTGTDYCAANVVLNRSAWGTEFYTDHSFKRHKLLSKKAYDVNDNLLQETINTYSENDSFNNEIFKKRFFRRNTNTPSWDDDFGPMMDVAKRYKQSTFKLKDSKTIDYYNGTSVESNLTEYEYNNIGLVSSMKRSANSGSAFWDPQVSGEYYIDNSTYVSDSNTSVNGISFLQSINYLSDLVESSRIFKTTTFTTPDTDDPVKGLRKEYKSNGFIDKLLVSDKENSFEEEIVFDSYNSRGKPTQFRDKQGKITSLFWSNDLLIAKIENASYISIKNYIQSNNGFNTDNCETNNCAQYFSEALRNAFPQAFINTYAYESSLEKPISVTDAKNETVYYEYDDIGRLIQVKDKYGNVLNTNEYNFKLPN